MTKKLDSVQYSLIKNYLDRSVESVEHAKADGSTFDLTDDKLICKTNVTLELKDVLTYADSFSSTQIVTEVNLKDLEIEDIRVAETSNAYHQFKLEILSYQSLDAETIVVKLKYSFGDMQVFDEDEVELCLASGVAIVDVKASKYRTIYSDRYDYTGERSIEIEVDFDRSNEMSQDQIKYANSFVEKTIDSYFDSFDIVFGFESGAFI